MNIQRSLAEDLSLIVGLPTTRIFEMFEIPPNPDFGDLSLPCFTLAKEMRMAPKIIANRFADAIADRLKMNTNKDAAPTLLRLIGRVESFNGYLNFYYDRSTLAAYVLNEIEVAGEKYGCSEMGRGKRVIVEFSSPNIAKPFESNTFIAALRKTAEKRHTAAHETVSSTSSPDTHSGEEIRFFSSLFPRTPSMMY